MQALGIPIWTCYRIECQNYSTAPKCARDSKCLIIKYEVLGKQILLRLNC